jgi:hypothetical protein
MVSLRSPYERFELISGNILGMLKFRGYIVDPEMKVRVEEDLLRVYHLRDDVKVDLPKEIIVFYSSEDRGIKIVQKLLAHMQQMKVTSAVFVTPLKLTPSGSSGLKAQKAKVRVQHFLDSEFLINPTLGLDTPKYILLTKEQANEILRDSEKDPRKLRQVIRSDPQSKYWGQYVR